MSYKKNNSPKVLHIVNEIGPSVIPFEIAQHIDSNRFDVAVISYYDGKKDLKAYIKDSDIQIIGIGARGRLDIRAFFRLYRVLKKIEPDILHVHHNLSGSLGRIAGKLAGVPIIIDTEHNDHKGFRFLGNILNGLTLNLSDAIICNSENTKNSFYKWEDYLISRNKKFVIYNGVDIKKIDSNQSDVMETRKNLGLNSSNFLIGNVGMLTKQKDQKTLIAAMKEVLQKVPSANLVIVGEGELRPKLENLVQKSGIINNVLFTGLVDRNQVYKILHSLDVFIMVSLWEGFCNAVVEAMASSKPVIVTNTAPFPEIVGGAGRYVPIRDSKALVKAILELKNNPKKRKEMGKAGRKRVEKKFTLKKTVKKYEKLYLKLLKEKVMIKRD